MARVTVEDCLKVVPSRFRLIHLVIKRVKQLRDGAEPLVRSDNREVVTALREVAAGLITLETIDRYAKKEKPASPYDISEILKQKSPKT
jgi:DNA-directed RNA polymerase subunit omega